MLDKVESNICQIIKLCLHESMSNQGSLISKDKIIKHFPKKLNIQQTDITKKSQGLWCLKNNHIECEFGLKFITNNPQTKAMINYLVNKQRNTQNNNNYDLFIQPASICNQFLSNKIKFEWAKLDNLNNPKQNGIKCRFNAMNNMHTFGIIPFVKCVKFDVSALNGNNGNQQSVETERALMLYDEYKTNYDDWYAQQYCDYYETQNDDDDEKVLQSINDNQQRHHYGAGQNGNHNGKNHMMAQRKIVFDDDEDIDLRYHRTQTQMNTSMNNRRERKRLFRHFVNENHNGMTQSMSGSQCQYRSNANKKRKFNHCMDRKGRRSLYRSSK